MKNSMLRFLGILLIPCLWLAVGQLQTEHQRVKFSNDFKNPEEVVRYYVARDASGFVWSGLLEIERRAFTLWDEIPSLDSFLVASQFEISKPEYASTAKDEATVSVTYDLTGIGDGHGAKGPPPSKKHQVQFRLRKSKGQWKIASPKARDIASVVLESKFSIAK